MIPVFAPHDPGSTLVVKAKKRVQAIPPEIAAQIAAEEAKARGEGNGSGPSNQDPYTTIPTHIELGRLLLNVPADVADNLRGPVLERHPIFLIMVHRGFYDQAVRQADSGIVLPGQPGPNAGSKIIIP